MAEDAGKSRGDPHMQVVDASSAPAAVEALNGVVVHERELRVSPSEPKKERATVPDGTFCSIYVRNLGRAVDESALKKVFQRAGRITSTAIMRDETGRSRGFGFVNYGSAADAARALAELDGHTDAGSVWQVSAPQKKPEREVDVHAKQFGGASAGRSDTARLRRQQANLYVRNLGEMASEHLRALFQEFGPIESASVLKAPDGSLRGVGFVQFLKPEDATRALAALHNKKVGERALVVEQARSKVQAARSYLEAAPSYAAAPGGVYMHAAAVHQGAMHASYATMGAPVPMGFARNHGDAAAGARAAKGGDSGTSMPLAYGYGGFGYGYGMPVYGASVPGYSEQRNVYGAAASGGANGAMYAGYGAPYGATGYGAPYGPYGTYLPVSPADMQHGGFYMPHAVPYQAYESGRGRTRARGGRIGSSVGGGTGGRSLYSSSRRSGESAPSSAPGNRAANQGGASHRGWGSPEARLPNGTHAAPADPKPGPAAGDPAVEDAPAVDATATVVAPSAAAAASARASAPLAQKAALDAPGDESPASDGYDAGPLQPAMAKLAVSSPPQNGPEPAAKGASTLPTAASDGKAEHVAPAAAPAPAHGG